MYKSKDGKAFGSAFVAKRRDQEHDKMAKDVMGAAPDQHEAKESPEFEKGEQEGTKESPEQNENQDASSVVAEHGPAGHVHVHSDHGANVHHVISHHKSGHVHHSKHTSAMEAHDAAKTLGGADEPEMSDNPTEEASEPDGFKMPRLG